VKWLGSIFKGWWDRHSCLSLEKQLTGMSDLSVFQPRWFFLAAAVCALLFPASAFAMHISEGILPLKWVGVWFAVAIPFVAWGLWIVRSRSLVEPHFKPLVGLVGAAVFVVSCMPIPVPFVGTCSHPCGTGMAAILIGPGPTIVVTSIALLLQALFLSHGGLSTLGANIVSMGIMGAFTGFGVFHLTRRLGISIWIAAFLAGLLSDWVTYATTSFNLALAFDDSHLLGAKTLAILAAFAPTQVPLGLAEGFVSMMAYRFIRTRRPELLAAVTGEARS
jgi:cobalt/nickel transport system permease protein